LTHILIYDHSHYKLYKKAWIATRPHNGHGDKRKIVQILGCNSAYVSQVLERDAHFSLEQLALLSGHMDHNELERTYFLLLVQWERAGNKILREHWRQQLDAILAQRLSLQHRLSHREELSTEGLAIYYSSWHYSAVHVLLLVPQFRTREALVARFQLPLKKVSEILDFLVAHRLATQERGQFHYGPVQVFVPENSPLAAKGHINWRLKAMASLDQQKKEDLHYTSVATVNHVDIAKIRAVLLRAVQDIRAIVKESTNEDSLICYDLDLFHP
jgi:uncharacterized protein (TIGR02147 family)